MGWAFHLGTCIAGRFHMVNPLRYQKIGFLGMGVAPRATRVVIAKKTKGVTGL